MNNYKAMVSVNNKKSSSVSECVILIYKIFEYVSLLALHQDLSSWWKIQFPYSLDAKFGRCGYKFSCKNIKIFVFLYLLTSGLFNNPLSK
jgi:hypothetical protein